MDNKLGDQWVPCSGCGYSVTISELDDNGDCETCQASTFSRLADRMSTLGFVLTRADTLAPVEGAPDRLAGTFDGVNIVVSYKVSDSAAIFLACHTFGHCQSWIRDPSLREQDASDPSWAGRPDRVSFAQASENEANCYGLGLLTEVAPEHVETYLDLARKDWKAFANYLGDSDDTQLGEIVPNVDLRAAVSTVRIAAAFELD